MRQQSGRLRNGVITKGPGESAVDAQLPVLVCKGSWLRDSQTFPDLI